MFDLATLEKMTIDDLKRLSNGEFVGFLADIFNAMEQEEPSKNTRDAEIIQYLIDRLRGLGSGLQNIQFIFNEETTGSI